MTRSADARTRPLARVSGQEVRQALAAGLVETTATGVQLSPEGRMAAGRSAAGEDRFAQVHRELEGVANLPPPDRGEPPLRNRNEPILARWRTSLDATQFEAGERFHADYVRSSLREGVTQSWDAAALSGVRGPGNAAAEMPACRREALTRVRRVYDRLGPRLGAIIDAAIVREESLAAMERRFRWPPRSGGAVLGVVLDLVAEVYGLSPQTPPPGSG